MKIIYSKNSAIQYTPKKNEGSCCADFVNCIRGLRGKYSFNWVLKRGVLGNLEASAAVESLRSAAAFRRERGWCLLRLAKGKGDGQLAKSECFSFAITLPQKFYTRMLLFSRQVTSDSLRPHGTPLECAVLDSPSRNTGVGCHALLQGSSPPRGQTQVSRVAGGFLTSWAIRPLHHMHARDWWYHEWWLISTEPLLYALYTKQPIGGSL